MPLLKRNFFSWTCEFSSNKVFTASDKVEVAEGMLKIGELAAQGQARLELLYEYNAATLRFWPVLSSERVEKIKLLGLRGSKGFMGLIARMRLLRHGSWAWSSQHLATLLTDGLLAIEKERIMDDIKSRMTRCLTDSQPG